MAKPAPPRKPAPRQAKPREAPAAKTTPLLEWVVAGVGLLCVLATAGVIAAAALRGDDSPADIVIRQTGVAAMASGYLLSIEVENAGGSPAATVVVEGALSDGDAPPQTTEATFDFIGGHSSAKGGLYFTADPRSGRLTLRAKGFSEP